MPRLARRGENRASLARLARFLCLRANREGALMSQRNQPFPSGIFELIGENGKIRVDDFISFIAAKVYPEEFHRNKRGRYDARKRVREMLRREHGDLFGGIFDPTCKKARGRATKRNGKTH
jgi:hypothetical protein